VEAGAGDMPAPCAIYSFLKMCERCGRRRIDK
jgi:hypothetical protein